MTVNIPLPNADERLEFIKTSMALAKNRSCGFACNIDDKEFARLTAGLTRLSIEDVILQGTGYAPITKKSILNKKEELVSREYSNILEILDASDLSLNDFAGQENVKAYFKEVVIDAIAKEHTSIIPKGVLLMGPPGTGKSFFARCLAGSAGINFVEFKMSKILDKYVGEAEKNLEKAFAVFRALAPVGVFIDEMDQALSRGNNDSNSVNKNLFGMFLAELSKPENRGKIIWLGATNYPDKIDEALKRTGRFDKKIPFFAPTKAERKLVFEKRIQKTSPGSKNIDYQLLADNTDGFTQAEIEGVVVKALELAIRAGGTVIEQDNINMALAYISSAQNERITEMENIALIECNDMEFLPNEYKVRRDKLLNVIK
jgi:SpoVK/Ycf46/Vps4 family AAA+-type ATPase